MATGININDFKTFTEFIAKKSGKGDYATPTQFNQLVNRAITEFVYKRNGNRKEYQPGRPVPNITYEKTSDVMDDLRYLKEVRTLLVQNGEVGIPDGSTVTDINGAICPEYIHLKSLRNQYYYQIGSTWHTKQYPIELVTEGELGMRLVSQVAPPTNQHPIAQELNASFKVYPTTMQYVVMDYLRYPVTAVWAYTEVNNRPVYDAANSVDIELPKECFNEIAMMYLSFLGINMRDGELVQYAEMKSKEGI